MNILEERTNLKNTIKRIDHIALLLEHERQSIAKELWDLKKAPVNNQTDIERMQDWIRGDLPFATLVHCLELPEDRSPYRFIKESRHLPLRCSHVDLYLDGSARMIGRDGEYICVKDLEELIGLFYCL